MMTVATNKEPTMITVGHTHPDVLPGTVVKVVTGEFEGGFGCEITGQWLVAGSDSGMTVFETRTVWIEEKNLKMI